MPLGRDIHWSLAAVAERDGRAVGLTSLWQLGVGPSLAGAGSSENRRIVTMIGSLRREPAVPWALTRAHPEPPIRSQLRAKRLNLDNLGVRTGANWFKALVTPATASWFAINVPGIWTTRPSGSLTRGVLISR